MHEGPHKSIEPGTYRQDKWGVRIEPEGDFGELLAFETLTLCPIDTRLVERSLLRPDEIAWLQERTEAI